MYMYERYDAKNWVKWKCYPGALTVLLPRFFSTVISLTVGGLILNVLLLGAPSADKPLNQVPRKSCIHILVQFVLKF